MNLPVALKALRQRGISISVEGEGLVWEADREPTESEARWIANHKAGLIRELTAVRMDFETAGPLDLAEVGAFAYAADPQTVVIMLAWCIGVGEVQIWWPGDPMPAMLRQAVNRGAVLVSHGAFDRIIWDAKLVPVGWPAVSVERWSDTSARARAYRVPAGLKKAALQLRAGLPEGPGGQGPHQEGQRRRSGRGTAHRRRVGRLRPIRGRGCGDLARA